MKKPRRLARLTFPTAPAALAMVRGGGGTFSLGSGGLVGTVIPCGLVGTVIPCGLTSMYPIKK